MNRIDISVCTWCLSKFSWIRQYYHLSLHHLTGLWLMLMSLTLRRKPGCHSPAHSPAHLQQIRYRFPKHTHYWKNKLYACQKLLCSKYKQKELQKDARFSLPDTSSYKLKMEKVLIRVYRVSGSNFWISRRAKSAISFSWTVREGWVLEAG